MLFRSSESVFDIKQIEEDINLSFKYLNTKVFMMSKLLTGGEEKVDHELCYSYNTRNIRHPHHRLAF